MGGGVGSTGDKGDVLGKCALLGLNYWGFTVYEIGGLDGELPIDILAFAFISIILMLSSANRLWLN